MLRGFLLPVLFSAETSNFPKIASRLSSLCGIRLVKKYVMILLQQNKKRREPGNKCQLGIRDSI